MPADIQYILRKKGKRLFAPRICILRMHLVFGDSREQCRDDISTSAFDPALDMYVRIL